LGFPSLDYALIITYFLKFVKREFQISLKFFSNTREVLSPIFLFYRGATIGRNLPRPLDIAIIAHFVLFVKGFLKKISRKFFSSSCVPMRVIYLNLITALGLLRLPTAAPHQRSGSEVSPLDIDIIAHCVLFVKGFFKKFLKKFFRYRVSKTKRALWDFYLLPLDIDSIAHLHPKVKKYFYTF